MVNAVPTKPDAVERLGETALLQARRPGLGRDEKLDVHTFGVA
ncbi:MULTISPECIES: hypothetical protein [unclassified Streptomyces]|nr:hypothetical protein OG199_20125 [Streptomyces sp. NBC_01176]